MRTVHDWLLRDGNFEKLYAGDVVDVEFILGERAEPKRSERITELQP